ncbi:hypothetical protein ACWCQS_34760 [Streptomyces sp. NPDC002076]
MASRVGGRRADGGARGGRYKTMAESVGKPVVLWQIPVGNMAQNNTLNHYKDDKVDWFFAHMDQVANAHVAGLLFGPRQQEQTTAESDGGNLIRKTIPITTRAVQRSSKRR